MGFAPCTKIDSCTLCQAFCVHQASGAVNRELEKKKDAPNSEPGKEENAPHWDIYASCSLENRDRS